MTATLARSTSSRRLVSVPETVPPPAACLRALRELHPRLELLCLAPNVWWIGEVKDTTAARVEGQARLAELHRSLWAGRYVRPLAFWKAQLMTQGFRMLALLTSKMPTPTECTMAVAPCLRATPASIEHAWSEGLKKADGTNRRAASSKWLREEYAPHQGRDSYRHAYHRPIHSLPEA